MADMDPDQGGRLVIRAYRLVADPDQDGGFVASAPGVPGVYDQGETADEALERLREGLAFHLDCMLEGGEEIPPSDITPEDAGFRYQH